MFVFVVHDKNINQIGNVYGKKTIRDEKSIEALIEEANVASRNVSEMSEEEEREEDVDGGYFEED